MSQFEEIEDDLEFLKEFPKNDNGMYIVYDRFSFDNLFRLLLANNFDHEDALMFMIANCSMSALVFQERIHNERYLELSAEDVLSADEAARRAKVIHDILQIAKGS